MIYKTYICIYGMELTQELVRYLFEYKDGSLYNKNVLTYSRNKIGAKSGFLFKRQRDNRYKVKIYGKSYYSARIIFLYHKGYLPEIVDHINRITTDDRIENLRAATIGQNNRNIKSRKNASSKYLGVSKTTYNRSYIYKKLTSKPNTIQYYVASIKGNGKKLHIGSFKTEAEAALAYNREAVRYHKEFANLNIIQPE